MSTTGPPLERLVRRVIEAPADFATTTIVAATAPYAGPVDRSGSIDIVAIAHDVMAASFGRGRAIAGLPPVDRDALDRFDAVHRGGENVRTSACALLLAWVLADGWFAATAGLDDAKAWMVLTDLASALAETGDPASWRTEPQRREELVRSVLASLEVLPEGETAAQAQDRLTAISSTARRRVLAAAQEAEERARSIREALASRAAQESADKYTRE